MRRTAALLIAAATMLTVAAVAFPKHKSAAPKPAPPKEPKQYNQFVTVHEFQMSKRTCGTLVSVEGYFVTGYRASTGTLLLFLTDSVDHVLNTDDAKKYEQRAALMTVQARQVTKVGARAWNRKGMMRYIMYTGKEDPKILLHDVIEKVRVTGSVGPLQGGICPVSRIEYMDENGYWKKL
jgi:hypothetical protein